jgi:hypothetical protein
VAVHQCALGRLDRAEQVHGEFQPGLRALAVVFMSGAWPPGIIRRRRRRRGKPWLLAACAEGETYVPGGRRALPAAGGQLPAEDRLA